MRSVGGIRRDSVPALGLLVLLALGLAVDSDGASAASRGTALLERGGEALGGSATPGDPLSSTLAKLLPRESRDPLAPFQLSLGDRLADVLSVIEPARRSRLRGQGSSYVHLSFGPPDQRGGRTERSTLSAPAGMNVLDGDLYFDAEETLIEASLVLSMELELEQTLDIFSNWLGSPDFEVVLPGGLDMLVGWRVDTGYLIGSFSDIPVFQISAFRHAPDDLMAGSHLKLFEGLEEYSAQLAAGRSQVELMKALLEVVAWVENARRKIEPVQ